MSKPTDIATLVEPIPTSHPRRWLVTLVAVLALICLAYLMVYWRPQAMPAGAPITANETWRMHATDYTLRDAADVVIVGSSFAEKIREGYFGQRGVRNLSLPGGSSLTGLEIVACHRPLPRVVLIEANILDRDSAAKFVGGYCHELPTVAHAQVLLQHFHPFRTALAGHFHGDPTSDFAVRAWAGEAARLRAETPRSYAIDEKIRAARSIYQELKFESKVHANALRMRALVTELERLGVRVYFFQMPLPPLIRSSRFFAESQTILKEVMGKEVRWLELPLRQEELRWIDAGHLDARSAVLVADAIESALADLR